MNFLVGEFMFFQSYFAGTLASNSDANWAEYKPTGRYGLNIPNRVVTYVETSPDPWPKKWEKVFDSVCGEFIVYHNTGFREFVIKNFTDL